MKSNDENLIRFRSISEIHKAFGLPKPQHPLLSLTHFNEDNPFNAINVCSYDVLNFYKINLTQNSGRMKYGQGYYDFDEGSMLFLAPDQLVGPSEIRTGAPVSYVLLVHPDFLLGHPLASKIKEYGFFSYSVNEALHLSDEEKETIISVFTIMQQELKRGVDEFSQEVMIAQIELLLTYANRFYKRQFVTRKAVNNDILQKLEALLDDYFRNDRALNDGLPTVHYVAAELNMTAGYLSDMLRSLISKNAQQYIHDKIIEKAKVKLSTTTASISEIAYELGFGHSQSFSKLFKNKTNQSPLEFRSSFNPTER